LASGIPFDVCAYTGRQLSLLLVGLRRDAHRSPNRHETV
jgi:hypothetical protein